MASSWTRVLTASLQGCFCRCELVGCARGGSPESAMTVAASFEQAGHYPLGVRAGSSHLAPHRHPAGTDDGRSGLFRRRRHAAASSRPAAGAGAVPQPHPGSAQYRDRPGDDHRRWSLLAPAIWWAITAAASCSGTARARPPPRFWSAAAPMSPRSRCWSPAARSPAPLVWLAMLFALPTARQLMRLCSGQDRCVASAHRHHRHQPDGAGSGAGAGPATGAGPEGAMGGAGDAGKTSLQRLLRPCSA